MESFFSRYKNAFVLIAILLAQTIALATQIARPTDASQPDASQVRLLRLWTISVISPMERVSADAGRGLRNAWSNYIYLRHVRQQNTDLQRQIAQLRLERAAMAEDALEGRRLQSLLGFRQQFSQSTVVAQVIGTSGTDASRLLTLDKGSRDGLRPDMAVITPDGIVGKLRDVFPTTSQLLLISDPTSGAGVILASTRIHAVIRGTPQGRVQILSLTPDSRVKPGETLLTSGGDRVFPRGLPVGTIESIAPDPEHQPYTAITVHPAANLTQLEEVLIITSTPAPQAQDPSEPGTHAADISAERLPSLHDDGSSTPDSTSPETQPDAPPPPDNSTQLVPKPKPVIHPDRYSPGSAPPAANLTPGSPRPPA